MNAFIQMNGDRFHMSQHMSLWEPVKYYRLPKYSSFLTVPEKRRKQAVAEMIDQSRRKGVNLGRPALGVTP
jgi:hypothetical protein